MTSSLNLGPVKAGPCRVAIFGVDDNRLSLFKTAALPGFRSSASHGKCEAVGPLSKLQV
jgi:hypothetical protein